MTYKKDHPKRYKDYPPNVPKKFIKLFFDCGRSVTKLSKLQGLNTGVVSAFLNDGHEPKDSNLRIKLLLNPHATCKLCGRKIVAKKSSTQKEKPEFLKQWSRLPTIERHKVIKQYLEWRKENEKTVQS